MRLTYIILSLLYSTLQPWLMLKNKTIKDVYINTANGMKRDEESNNKEREFEVHNSRNVLARKCTLVHSKDAVIVVACSYSYSSPIMAFTCYWSAIITVFNYYDQLSRISYLDNSVQHFCRFRYISIEHVYHAWSLLLALLLSGAANKPEIPILWFT